MLPLIQRNTAAMGYTWTPHNSISSLVPLLFAGIGRPSRIGTTTRELWTIGLRLYWCPKWSSGTRS